MGTEITWIKLEEELPVEGQLCWVKRNKNTVYLGHRRNNPLTTNPDVSQDCYWHANIYWDLDKAEHSKYEFRYNFSDVTVEGWMPLEPPKI
jgi:hypothetical protein